MSSIKMSISTSSGTSITPSRTCQNCTQSGSRGIGIEIGIGTGRFAAPLGITKGIEPSKAMAKVAARKGLEVVPGVAEKLPFPDNE